MNIKKQLTLIVGSCDKYSHIWSDFALQFNKYWDLDISMDKYILSETVSYNGDEFKTLLPGPGTGPRSWTPNLKYALNKIKTPYILWLQDDYFLQKTVCKAMLVEYMRYIVSNSIDRFGIESTCRYYSLDRVKHDKIDQLYKFKQNSMYLTSLQASIWNKKFLSSVLELGDWTPWEFEMKGTPKVSQHKQLSNAKIMTTLHDDPPWYREAMKKGRPSKYYREEFSTINK